MILWARGLLAARRCRKHQRAGHWVVSYPVLRGRRVEAFFCSCQERWTGGRW